MDTIKKISPISEDNAKVILESISEGVFTVDYEWRITSFNHAAEKITGIVREEAIGKPCYEVFRSNMCESDCALRRTMKKGVSLIDTTAYIVNQKQRKIPVKVSTALLKDEKGNVIGGVETFRDMSLIEDLRKELSAKYQIGDIVSHSHNMEKIIQLLPKVAESNSTILIQGETGTGKELIARAIHDLSERNKNPFIAVNCGALPDTLLESELFGYKAGAFTNAIKDKPGHFAMAEGGTILLDEIGDTSPAFQVRLLRVLQEKTYLPLGGTKPVPADVAVIASSNKNLKDLVHKGKFREDLFYRINVMRLVLPPLRERKNDIPILADHFIEKLNKIKNRSIVNISHEAMDVLMSHDYPGNIRELENIIEHAFILCSGDTIETDSLPDYLLALHDPFVEKGIQGKKRIAETKAILEALRHNHYNRQATAHELGIHKSTLFRKLKSLNIKLPDKEGRLHTD